MFSRKSANRFIGGALVGYALYRAWEFYVAARDEEILAEDSPQLIADLEAILDRSLNEQLDAAFAAALNDPFDQATADAIAEGVANRGRRVEDIPNLEGPL